MHNIHDGNVGRPSTLALTLLSVMPDCEEATRYALEHLRLDRAPLNALDRLDAALFADLVPILRETLGDCGNIPREAIQHAERATLAHWHPYITEALAIHDTTLREEHAFKVALAHWNHRGGANWQHPNAALLEGVPPFPWGAFDRWRRQSPTARTHHPLRAAALLERRAQRLHARGDRGAVRTYWERYQLAVTHTMREAA